MSDLIRVTSAWALIAGGCVVCTNALGVFVADWRRGKERR